MRPDVVPSTEGWPAWTALASGDDPALQRRCGGDVDMGRVMIRGDADRFLRHPAQILRNCALGGGNEAEDIVRHSAPPPFVPRARVATIDGRESWPTCAQINR